METTTDLIVRLKDVKAQRKLTVADVQRAVEQTGEFVSETTLRRVFAAGSETDDSFSYDRTIRPIAKALLFADAKDDADLRSENEALKALVLVKGEQIQTLRDHLDDRDRRISFLLQQIAKKDERMDRKDKIIEQLMEKVFSAS